MTSALVKSIKNCTPLRNSSNLSRFEHLLIDVPHIQNLSIEEMTVLHCFARDDFSGWAEGRPLRAANSQNVARFIYEDRKGVKY